MICEVCKDRGWLCEAHPNEPFEHMKDGKVCPGPGDPCPKCNDLSPHFKERPDEPQISHLP